MKLELNIRSRISSLAREDGFGIVEALVAAIILIVAVLATFTAYDASTRGTFRAQQSQVRLGQAQQEMEKIRALPYDQIAMTSTPGFSSDPSDPLNRVQNGDFNLDRNGANYATLVVNGGTLIGGDGTVSGGMIDPGPEHFQSGDVGGDIYRFVVWQRNNGCDSQRCTSQDFKRVIIVVKPDITAAGGSRDYVEIHSDFIDPNDSSTSDLPPNGGERVTGQQFWLTDTPCDSGGDTVRQDISEQVSDARGDNWFPNGSGVNGDGHYLHNTFGSCANGVRTGTTAGAPDALIPSQPPGDPANPPPAYDYNSDLEPNPNTDKGIQIQPVSSGGCVWRPGVTNPTEFHVWLTDPMDSNFMITRSATLGLHATLVFFSKTINNAKLPGRVCAWLFVRPPNWPISPDTLLHAPFSFSAASWPKIFGQGTPLKMDMGVGVAPTVPAGSRLGLAVSVGDRNDTQVGANGGLEFMYDHPSYPARLEVQTTTPCNSQTSPPC